MAQDEMIERIERLLVDDPICGGRVCGGTIEGIASIIRPKMEKLREVDVLLTELLDGPSKGEFYGIDRCLRAKLDNVRRSARAALTTEGEKSDAA